ncbi:hypothetical protein KIW84_014562 [Lathyrus oleraceus]|uniref:Uncharacterized protein n=1 Tax=Pisum sativum TaxID=3888 RepID=A0A9D5GZR6_PEA|nr:hypothetical protein KIW84_014562 [Pisum sativum]
MALREIKLVINDHNTPEEKEKLTKWERSDRLSLCDIKRTVYEHLISGFPEKENAKEYLTTIGEREYILRMVDVQTKLKFHNIDLDENFIVSHALNFLPIEFTQIKTAYNTFGDKWVVNNLITKCVADEEKLKKERIDLAFLVVDAKSHFGKNSWKNKKNTHNASHRHPEFRKYGNGQHHNVRGLKPVAFKKSFWCFWCKENGHKKTYCHAFKAWLYNKNKFRGV